jgi:predicted ATPase
MNVNTLAHTSRLNVGSHCLQLGFGSVSELLLYRLDALDSSVRNALHLAAVLGTEFELVEAALAYDEMYQVRDSERAQAALALRESFDIAVEEGIIEESFVSSNEEEDFDEPSSGDAQASLCASLGNIMISFKGFKKSHPAYSENRRYRFTHDSWKTSILNSKFDAYFHLLVGPYLKSSLISWCF